MSPLGNPCLLRGLSVRLLLCIVGCSLVWIVVADENGPVIPRGKGDQCVAETDFMRRDHMRLLLHQRDETVIRGLRDEPFSLAECVDCHAQVDAQGQAMRIDAEGQFCQSCHAYAAVKIDCFGCHAAKPEQAAAVPMPADSALFRLPHSAQAAQTVLSSLATYRYQHTRKDNRND